MENKVAGAVKERYVGFAGQVRIYLKKFFRIFMVEKQWVTLILSAAIAFLVAEVIRGSVFITMEGTKTGCLALACVCLWNGMFNSIQVVCRERPMIKREHRSGLKVASYLGAHMLLQAGICITQVLIMIVILGLCGTSFPEHGLVFSLFELDLFITFFLITYASDMLGLMVSCLVHSTTIAMTVMPFILIVQLVFAGIAFPLSGRAQSLSNLTITKWGITALAIEADYNSLSSNVMYTQLVKMGNDVEPVGQILKLVDPDQIKKFSAQYAKVEDYAYETGNLLECWGIELLFTVIFAIGGVVALSFIDHDKR